MRALAIPTRNMATVIPLPPPKHKDKSLKKKKEEDVAKKDESIEKIPKQYVSIFLKYKLHECSLHFLHLLTFLSFLHSTQPGSKYALKSEDFSDEASYEKFANEPQKDKNPTWRKFYSFFLPLFLLCIDFSNINFCLQPDK